MPNATNIVWVIQTLFSSLWQEEEVSGIANKYKTVFNEDFKILEYCNNVERCNVEKFDLFQYILA